jgi:hypothetical protein
MLPFEGAKNRAAAGLSIALPLHTVCVVICVLDSGENEKVYGHSWSFFETATRMAVARTIALNNLRPETGSWYGLWQNASIVFFDVVKDNALAELRIEKRTFTSSCCLADAAVERSGGTFGWQPATGWRACLCADSVILPGQDDSDRRVQRQRRPILHAFGNVLDHISCRIVHVGSLVSAGRVWPLASSRSLYWECLVDRAGQAHSCHCAGTT